MGVRSQTKLKLEEENQQPLFNTWKSIQWFVRGPISHFPFPAPQGLVVTLSTHGPEMGWDRKDPFAHNKLKKKVEDEKLLWTHCPRHAQG